MKKRTLCLLTVFAVLTALLAGCGAKAADSVDVQSMQLYGAAGTEETMDMAAGYAPAAAAPVPEPADEGAKIIHTADMELETTAFEQAEQALSALTEQCGGYYESSSVNAGGSRRSARYTIRIPAEQYRDFLSRAGSLCHLMRVSEYTQDVSEYYYDTAGRLQTQRTKLERLRQLLAEAEDMEDVIALESAMSETEEQIDRLTGELSHYDAQADYSTVTVYLQEVYRLSNVEEPAQGFGARLTAALRAGMSGFVTGMQALAVALAYGWVWLLLLAGAAAGIVMLCRRHARKKRAARAAQSREDGQG